MSFVVTKLTYQTEFSNGLDKAVLASIAEQAHDDGECYEGSTSIEWLVRRVCFSRDSVMASLKRLRGYGVLVALELENGKQSRYRIDLSKLGEGYSYQADVSRREEFRKNRSGKPTGRANQPVGQTDLDQSGKPTATGRAKQLVPVGQTDRSIYKETNQEQSSNQSSRPAGWEFVEDAFQTIKRIPACQNARGIPVEEQKTMFSETAKRLGYDFDQEFVNSCHFIVNRAISKPYYLSETSSISAGAILDTFHRDVVASRSNISEATGKNLASNQKFSDPMEVAVDIAFQAFAKLGGALKGADVSTYARILREANIQPEVVSNNAEAALSGLKYIPIVTTFTDLFRKFHEAGPKVLKVLDDGPYRLSIESGEKLSGLTGFEVVPIGDGEVEGWLPEDEEIAV